MQQIKSGIGDWRNGVEGQYALRKVQALNGSKASFADIQGLCGISALPRKGHF